MTYLERRAASRDYKSQDAANAQHPGKGHGLAHVEELLARCDLQSDQCASFWNPCAGMNGYPLRHTVRSFESAVIVGSFHEM